MIFSTNKLIPFFKKVESQLQNRITGNPETNAFQEIISETEECFFIFDLTQNKIVTFSGMKKLFGYEDKNIDLPFILDKTHPEDLKFIQNFISYIISKALNLEIPLYTNIFSLASRFRKSNDDYIRVVTDNFIIQTNKNKLVQSILIKYTDISFMDNSTTVDWKINPDYFDQSDILSNVYQENKNIFTKREKEIIILILTGTSNVEIAKTLNISKHTVATHRKNIFSKSKCSGREKLKSFCKKNGVLNGDISSL